MTQPTTLLTVDGKLILTTEAGSVILTHEQAKLLAGRLSMDLSALKARQSNGGTYPNWVATREAYAAATPAPANQYYVSTTQSAAVRVTSPFDTLAEAEAHAKDWLDQEIYGFNGYPLVIRDTLYGSVVENKFSK